MARTIKGYGLGEAGEGKNITHQQKKLNEEEMLRFRDRFNIPMSDDEVRTSPIHALAEDSPEIVYLRDRRRALGGPVPSRSTAAPTLPDEPGSLYDEFKQGTDGRAVSTTMAFVRLLNKLMSDREFGRYIVPIVPDEARTFGMEAMFPKVRHLLTRGPTL